MLAIKVLLGLYFVFMSYMSFEMSRDTVECETKLERGLYFTSGILGLLSTFLILLV